MSWIKQAELTIETLKKRIEALERESRDRKDRDLNQPVDNLLTSGAQAIRALSSRELWAFVRIVDENPDGSFAARHVAYDTGGGVTDDADGEATLKVYPRRGACLFPGCLGLARYMGLDPTNTEPYWWMVAGEGEGMAAKITGDHVVHQDSYWYYPYIEAGFMPPGVTPWSGEALDLASTTYDPNITERLEIPTGTIVQLHWNPDARRMEFVLGVEPRSKLCTET